MSEANLSPSEILSIRFILTVFLCGLMMLLRDGSLFISLQYFSDIIIIAACLIILPLYLAQISIKLLEPMTVAIGAPLMPIIVIIFETARNKIHPSFPVISSTIITTILVLSGIYMRYKKNRYHITQPIKI
jgi:hypothetical protein